MTLSEAIKLGIVKASKVDGELILEGSKPDLEAIQAAAAKRHRKRLKRVKDRF